MSPGEKNSALVKTSNLYGQGEDLLNLFFFLCIVISVSSVRVLFY